jgi:hypothetical protein
MHHPVEGSPGERDWAEWILVVLTGIIVLKMLGAF